MANVTYTPEKIAPIYPVSHGTEMLTTVTAEDMTQGQAAYTLADGTTGIAGAAAAGKQQFRGLNLKKRKAGQTSGLLKRGFVAGFDVDALPVDTPLFLSDTLGTLSTTAGTKSVPVGRVALIWLVENKYQKCVYIDADWRANY